jgi:hypothetical protein
MKINIPKGTEINKLNNDTIKIKVPETNFWVIGEQNKDKTWNAYLFNPETNERNLIKENKTTASFSLFSEIVLKTPFPYQGKKAQNKTEVKKFINKITKKI